MKPKPVVSPSHKRLPLVEVALFLGAFAILSAMSGSRLLRQSAAPHFVHQAKAYLDGRLRIEVSALPNFEDWACVRATPEEAFTRCTPPALPNDNWYSSFPPFPAVVFMPFVALHGYEFNDTFFTVFVGALGIVLFYRLLRRFNASGEVESTPLRDALFALLLGFGTVYFYISIRGEVWFTAETMGVSFTLLYMGFALRARRPFAAGLTYAMATLTRTPLAFTGIFFLLEALAPTKGKRLAELRSFFADPRPRLRVLGLFALGAAPLAILAAVNNYVRFGALGEFGHRFFFDNMVNRNIDTFGLFSTHYLPRNLDAAFLMLPRYFSDPPMLIYNPWGMSLFITLPILALAFVPANRPRRALVLLVAMALTLAASALIPIRTGIGHRSLVVWGALAVTVGLFAFSLLRWLPKAPRLVLPLTITFLVCAIPGLTYQNTGYAQFGFRFSLDYTPYIFALAALAGWQLTRGVALCVSLGSLAAGTWGALAFRGFTEISRR